MHVKAWWLFTFAWVFAFFLSYRKVVPQQDSIKASFNCVLGRNYRAILGKSARKRLALSVLLLLLAIKDSLAVRLGLVLVLGTLFQLPTTCIVRLSSVISSVLSITPVG